MVFWQFKKITFTISVMAAFFAMGLVSCASMGNVQETRPAEDKTVKVNIDDDVDKVVVIDWTDRTLGEIAVPTWLKNMRRGNSGMFKQQWGTDANRVVKVSMATGKTEAMAQALSRAGFAYTQAAELSQKVIGRVGQGLNNVGQLEALYVAASETKAGTKDQIEQYIYYTVYSMDKGTWDNLCKKYLIDIMGGPDLTTETQKKGWITF